MVKENVIIRFSNVTFKYNEDKVILDDVDFSIRENSKITVMGQNGAGKSTLFKLLTGELRPNRGEIHIKKDTKIGIARQMIHQDKLKLTVLEYFKSAFDKEFYGIEKNIQKVLSAVNLNVENDVKISDLSGGQKARILLAYALIQKPDILLLDEPTNNLDEEGINHLTGFLIMYQGTVVVISHDTNFLNTFTDGVLNLDVHTKKIEQFVGDYYDVLEQIKKQIERERLANAKIVKSIKQRFEKVNKLGGKSVAMRRLARKTRSEIADDKENMVDMRQEDKTIPAFTIPAQHVPNPTITIEHISLLIKDNVKSIDTNISLSRGSKLLISGPNGIGKTTLLKAMLKGTGVKYAQDLRIGYYSQDFSELDFDQTAFDSLKTVMLDENIRKVYETASKFLLTGSLLKNKIGSLSEGQKGLLSYARFVLQQPGLLILDEPTNHINFRHLPVLAKAINDFTGAVILVTHIQEFISQIDIDNTLDLTKYTK